MDEEEQVLGVLKQCSICDDKTLHVDGVCQSHKIIRRKKQPRPPQAPARTPPRRGRVRLYVSIALALALVGLLGAVHVVHGNRGIHVCWKDGWSLSDTLVDLDDVQANKPTDTKLLDALDKCLD